MHSRISAVVIAAVALMGCPSPMNNTGGGGGGGSATGGGNGGGSSMGGGSATGGGSGGGSATGGGSGGGGMMGTKVTCANAIAIATPGSVTGDTSTNANSFEFSGEGNCKKVSAAPDVVYSIMVPAGQRLKATVDMNDTMFDVVLNIVAGSAATCGMPSTDGGDTGIMCVASSDNGYGGDPESAIYTNTTGAAQTVFILIDGYQFDSMSKDQGAFRLTTSVAPPPAGDDCGTATTVMAGMTSGQSLAEFADDYRAGPGCMTGTTLNDRVYKVSVPAGNRLTATVTDDANPDGGSVLGTTVNLVTGTCTMQLTCENGANDTGTQKAVYDNIGTGAQDVFIVVDTSDDQDLGATFSLNVELAPTTFQPGEVCGNTAAAITTTTTLMNQSFSGYVSNYDLNGGASCLYSNGPDRAYAVDIPVGQVMHAVATGGGADGGPDIALNVVDAANLCGSGACITASDSNGPEAVTVGNVSGAAVKHVKVVVDSNDLSPMASYNLALTIGPPPVGDTCTMPTVIAAAGTLMNETTVGFLNDYSPSDMSTNPCTGATEDGSDHVYSFIIPAGKMLTVTVTPTGATMDSADPAVYIIDSPATNCVAVPMSCLAGKDMAFEGMPETVTYTNAGMTPQTVFIVVDSYTLAGGPAEFTYNLTTATN